MKEGVTTPILGFQAPPQLVPVTDLVHRLISDDLAQEARRRRPVDPLEPEKACIEPGRQQVSQVRIQSVRIVDLAPPAPQVRPQPHEAGRSVARQVEVAEELLAAGLGSRMKFGQGRRVRAPAKPGDGALQAHRVRGEAHGQSREERPALGLGSRFVAGEYLLGEGGREARRRPRKVFRHRQQPICGQGIPAPDGGAQKVAPGLDHRDHGASRRHGARPSAGPSASQIRASRRAAGPPAPPCGSANPIVATTSFASGTTNTY